MDEAFVKARRVWIAMFFAGVLMSAFVTWAAGRPDGTLARSLATPAAVLGILLMIGAAVLAVRHRLRARASAASD